jgi:hypothetical protein
VTKHVCQTRAIASQGRYQYSDCRKLSVRKAVGKIATDAITNRAKLHIGIPYLAVQLGTDDKGTSLCRPLWRAL